jgi:hypothetical protein
MVHVHYLCLHDCRPCDLVSPSQADVTRPPIAPSSQAAAPAYPPAQHHPHPTPQCPSHAGRDDGRLAAGFGLEDPGLVALQVRHHHAHVRVINPEPAGLGRCYGQGSITIVSPEPAVRVRCNGQGSRGIKPLPHQCRLGDLLASQAIPPLCFSSCSKVWDSVSWTAHRPPPAARQSG